MRQGVIRQSMDSYPILAVSPLVRESRRSTYFSIGIRVAASFVILTLLSVNVPV